MNYFKTDKVLEHPEVNLSCAIFTEIILLITCHPFIYIQSLLIDSNSNVNY